VAPDSAFDVTYRVRNTGTADGAFALTVTDTATNLSVAGFGGDVRDSNPDGTPPTVSTTEVSASGGTASVTVTYRTAQNASGSGAATVQALASASDTSDTATIQVSVRAATVPANLQRFTGGDDTVGNFDVLSAVNAVNNGDQIGGEDVSNLDVLNLVNYVTSN
jgi:hypothetical protein